MRKSKVKQTIILIVFFLLWNQTDPWLTLLRSQELDWVSLYSFIDKFHLYNHIYHNWSIWKIFLFNSIYCFILVTLWSNRCPEIWYNKITHFKLQLIVHSFVYFTYELNYWDYPVTYLVYSILSSHNMEISPLNT